jgi:CheY-like chemotaxis protein
VLLVEDEPDIRFLVRATIERLTDWELLEAEHGLEGAQLAREVLPDVILLDVVMPQLDGRATVEALRTDPATADTPVIFLTAGVHEDELRPLRQLGAADIIVKPFDPMALPLRIATAMEWT